MDFNIGDRVNFRWMNNNYTGTIIGDTLENFRIIFDNPHLTWGLQADRSISISKSFHGSALSFAGPPLTTKERVSKRIKFLWNNSNYVKKHPTQAYT